MSEGTRFRVTALAVFLLALAMRSLPMVRSPLPVRADGLFLAADAARTVRTGVLPVAGMATDDFGYTPLMAVVAVVTGVDPWLIAQPVSSLVGAIPVLVVIAVTLRLGRRLGWTVARTRGAALVAGTFLAVEGLYLHRANAADEQTAGLLLVPLAVLALYRARLTNRRAWWLVGGALLAVLPPLHNLEAMVTALALGTLCVFVLARGPLDRPAGTLLAVTGAFLVVFPAYHVLMERYTAAVITQQSRLTEVPGLFAAWFVAGALVVAWATRTRPRTQQVAGWAVFAAMFGLIALNAWHAVFPGMPRTPPSVLLLVLPLAFPAALAAWRVPDLADDNSDGPALLAMAAAAVVVIGASLTAALTPEYLGTAYRTSLFLHVPVAVPVGLGTVELLRRRPLVGRPSLQVGAVALVVVAAAVSVPLSFGGLAPFNEREITPPGERAAAEFATAHVDGEWAADDHTRRLAAAVAGNTSVAWDPVYAWLVDGHPPPNCPTLVERSWTTRGTQFLTTAPVVLPRGEYREWRATSTVVYDGGDGRDRVHLGYPRGARAPGC